MKALYGWSQRRGATAAGSAKADGTIVDLGAGRRPAPRLTVHLAGKCTLHARRQAGTLALTGGVQADGMLDRRSPASHGAGPSTACGRPSTARRRSGGPSLHKTRPIGAVAGASDRRPRGVDAGPVRGGPGASRLPSTAGRAVGDRVGRRSAASGRVRHRPRSTAWPDPALTCRPAWTRHQVVAGAPGVPPIGSTLARPGAVDERCRRQAAVARRRATEPAPAASPVAARLEHPVERRSTGPSRSSAAGRDRARVEDSGP